MQNKLFIAGYIPVSLIDYPDKISSVIFTHGCNIRCKYCHNPELVVKGKGDNLYDEFIDFVKGKDIEGVVITGGEPLVSSGLKEFIAGIKSMNLSVKLDTNGTSPARLKEIIEMVDFVAIDLKAFNDEDYRDVTRSNFSLENFYACIDLIREHNVNFHVRHTMWKNPDYNEVRAALNSIGESEVLIQPASKENRTLDRRFNPPLDLDHTALEDFIKAGS